MDEIPRLRVLAGPNGSGKSTIKALLPEALLGLHINPDEIERSLQCGVLDLKAFEVVATQSEVAAFLRASTLLQRVNLLDIAAHIRVSDGQLYLAATRVNSYIASVLSDFLRTKLISNQKSLSFETVMSWPDKIEILGRAQRAGYRTYLYYVATEDPEINIRRVQNRVRAGGHDVPMDKIRSRYFRSLALLSEAIRVSNRAYIFDNSGSESFLVAEITNGRLLEVRSEITPRWFKAAIGDSQE